MKLLEIEKNLKETKSTLSTSKKLLLLFWSFDKKIFITMIISVSIPAVIPFINAYIYKLIIDFIVEGINSDFNLQELYFLIGLRFVTLFTQHIALSIQNFAELLLWSRMPIHLYHIVLSKLANLDLEYFENSAFQDNLQKIRESYAWMPLNMLTNLFYTIQSIIQVIIAFLAIATFNLALAAGIIVVSLPGFVNQLYFSKTLWGVWSEHSPYRKKFWYLSGLLQNKEGVKESKIFGTAEKFLKEILGIQRNFARENLSVGKKRLRISIFLGFFSSFVFIVAEIFVVIMTILGRITLGSLSYYTFVIWNFQGGVSGLFQNFGRVYDQSLYVKEIFTVLEAKSKVATHKNAVKVDKNKPAKIEFKNVDFSYPGTKEKVLDNFSLVINPGEKVAFVGENGAGKTTIIKLLARFYDVTRGNILINDTDIKNIDLPSWYQAIGVIFQDFLKYEYTLAENIHFGLLTKPFDIQKIKSAAGFAGADGIAQNLPRGYSQILGKTFEGGLDLSHGEWQKVALARAFLRNAPILILDEPTAAIDAKSEQEIFDKVEKLGRDKTVIIISHRFSTVKNADKIYVIEKGKIVEFGNHVELMAKKGKYNKLFNIQAKRYKED